MIFLVRRLSLAATPEQFVKQAERPRDLGLQEIANPCSQDCSIGTSHPRRESSNTSARLTRFAKKALVLAITMVLLQSLVGRAQAPAGSPPGALDRKELSSIIQKLLEAASDDCKDEKTESDVDRCTRGYLAYVLQLLKTGHSSSRKAGQVPMQAQPRP